MTFTVLTDDQIRGLLENLTPSELEGFRNALAAALRQHAAGDTSIQQPERISIHSTATGATTLFMPSASSAGNGIKVITLSSPAASTTTTSSSSSSSSSSSTPSSSPPTSKPTIRPTGAVALFTPQGAPLGLLHASTLTAFRTALASLCVVHERLRQKQQQQQQQQQQHTLVVFGGGEQAYWHVRLTLLLLLLSSSPRGCGSDPDPDAAGARARVRVWFVDPRRSRRRQPRQEGEGKGDGEGSKAWGAWVVGRLAAMDSGAEFGVLTREDEGYEEKLAAVLREADVVFCCTPSTEPLFDARVFSGGGEEEEEKKKKGRLVVAIGSYTPEMREVPVELIRRATAGKGEKEAGVVVVDTLEGAMVEAGELIEAGVRKEQLVELGDLVTVDGQRRREDLAEWLQTSNVIYKSVGMGLMDLAVGTYLVEFAQQKGVGTRVPGF